jgi:hypothetical protein
MRASLIFASGLALSTFAACGGGGGGGSINAPASLSVENDSSFTLTEVRVAPVDQVDWGPNLLPDVLFPGESLTIDLDCDTYDVLVSDNAGRSCELDSLDLCFSDDIWHVDDATLANCGF